MAMASTSSSSRPRTRGLVEFAVGVKEMSAPAGFRIDDQDGALRRLHRALQPQASVQHAELERSSHHRRDAVPYYHSKGSYKELYHYSNKEMDQLLDDGRKEPDLKKRKVMYGRVQKMLSESGPVVIPYHRPYMAALHKGVQGYEIHPIRWADVRRTWLSTT